MSVAGKMADVAMTDDVEALERDLAQSIAAALDAIHAPMFDDKKMRDQLAAIFNREHLIHARGFHLGNGGVVDFWVPKASGTGTAIFVRLKALELRRLLLTIPKVFAGHDLVSGIILITNRPFMLPGEMHGKPCTNISLRGGV